MATKTYTNEELNALVAEFSAEFDALVKAEVAKTAAPLAKADDDGGSDEKEKKSPPSDSGSDSGGGDEGGGGGDSADAGAPPPPAASAAPDASASPAPAPAGDPAAGSAPAAPQDPAQAGGGDPMAALSQAYAQLSPEELQMHFQALKQVLTAQMAAAPAGGAPGADPMAAAAGAPPAPAAPAPAPAAPAAPAPAPGPAMGAGAGAAPLAGEASKPVDPMASMALKSEFEKELNLVKSERDNLKKSVEQLTETMTKVLAQPIRKSVTGKDIEGLLSSEQPVKSFDGLSKAEVTKKLLAAAKNPDLKKSDRDLINKYYKSEVKVDALAHLLG